MRYLLAVLLLIFILTAAGCSRQKPPEPPPVTNPFTESDNTDYNGMPSEPKDIYTSPSLSVEIECVTYPKKKAASAVSYEFGAQVYAIPFGKVEFAIEFSKPMDKESVVRVLEGRREPGIDYEFSWDGDSVLYLTVEGHQNNTVAIDLSGSLDKDGHSLIAMQFFSFFFIPPRVLSTYNIETGTTKALFTMDRQVSNARLSPDKNLLLFQESVYHHNSQAYQDYFFDLRQYTLSRIGDEYFTYINTRPQPYAWSGDGKYLATGGYVYDNKGEIIFPLDDLVTGIAFSPDGSKLGGFYSSNEKRLLDTNLILYETATGKMLKEFPSFTQLQYDLTYFPQPLYSHWREDGKIIYEDTSWTSHEDKPWISDLDEKQEGIMIFDPDSGQKAILFAGGSNMFISPHGQTITFALDGETYLADNSTMAKEKIYDSLFRDARWSPDNSTIAFCDGDNIFIFDMVENKLNNPELSGQIAGWLDDKTLLIISAKME